MKRTASVKRSNKRQQTHASVLDHVTLVLVTQPGNRLSTIFNLISLSSEKKKHLQRKIKPLKTSDQQHPCHHHPHTPARFSTNSHKNLMCFTGVPIEQNKKFIHNKNP
jgi:hypothetical protein